jgi:CheY-like chemotaxis protein
VKFTEKGSISVDVKLEELIEDEKKSIVHFSVKDTGVGIPEEKINRIFESFSQADSSITRKFGGTGLGLTISSKLVELMGGKIWVESEEGKGSTFHFTIQYIIPEKRENRTEPEKAVFNGKTILIVDDDPKDIKIFEEATENWGMKVVYAESGKKAISQMKKKRRKPFDIILINQDISDMKGLEVVSKIRNELKDNITPIIVMPSASVSISKDEKKMLGISTILVKPLNVLDMFCAIDTAIADSKREETIEIEKKSEKCYNILLVEDHLINQKLAVTLLEKRNNTVTVANNGVEAVDILKDADFDLVLMDIQMPEMDGFEATKLIRDKKSKVKRHDIPIIAMTAHAMRGDKEKCIETGMDGYISKPINVNELFSEITRIAGSNNNGIQT